MHIYVYSWWVAHLHVCFKWFWLPSSPRSTSVYEHFLIDSCINCNLLWLEAVMKFIFRISWRENLSPVVTMVASSKGHHHQWYQRHCSQQTFYPCPLDFPGKKNQHKDLQVNKIYMYIMCNYNFLLYKYYDHGRKLISMNFSKIRFKLKT